jgi:replication-associated recombination protein RarA
VKTVNGHLLTEVVSALQKCIRRGDEDGALYFGVDMYLSNYAEYAWKRMRIMVSEDIGLAEPNLPANFEALYNSYTALAKKKDPHAPEKLMFVHAILLLSRAKKSRIVDHALIHHFLNHGKPEVRREIPDAALDKHTVRGRKMGRGFDHFFNEGAKLENAWMEDPYLDSAKRTLIQKENAGSAAVEEMETDENGQGAML